MNNKTMADVIAEDSVKFIKLPFFLTALQFSPQNKGCDITNEVFFRLLDKGLMLHFSEPGYVNDGVKISNGDVKCALRKIEDTVFEADTQRERDKLFSREIIKTESGYEIPLFDILIGQDNVKQLYSHMGLDSYPWVKVPWAYDANDCTHYFTEESVNQPSDFNEKYKKNVGSSFRDESETDQEFEIAFDVFANPKIKEIGISDTRINEIVDKKNSSEATLIEKQNAIAELASLRLDATKYNKICNDILVNRLPPMPEEPTLEDRIMRFVWLHELEAEKIKVNKCEWSNERDRKFEQLNLKIKEIKQQLNYDMNENIHSFNAGKRKTKNEQRDKDFLEWLKEQDQDAHTITDLMTKQEIQNKLITRNQRLWTQGFNDWWKYQTILKGKCGRKRTTS